MGVPLDIVQVSGPNRIPFLMTHKADLVISSFAVTAERAKVVAFSLPYSVNQLVIGAPKDVAITKMDDLNGKRVAVVRGNLQDLVLTKQAPKGATLVRYEDDATANTALIAGQVDAIATPSFTVQTLAQKNPAKNLQVKFMVSATPLAIGMRKGDTELMNWVNGWVEKNLANGELNKIYQKHMGLPLPDMKKLAEEAKAAAL
jgi:polar amino acid transport system substrate-binding protein